MIYKGDSISCYSAIIVLQELENVWIIALKSFPAELLSPVRESSPHYTVGHKTSLLNHLDVSGDTCRSELPHIKTRLAMGFVN